MQFRAFGTLRSVRTWLFSGAARFARKLGRVGDFVSIRASNAFTTVRADSPRDALDTPLICFAAVTGVVFGSRSRLVSWAGSGAATGIWSQARGVVELDLGWLTVNAYATSRDFRFLALRARAAIRRRPFAVTTKLTPVTPSTLRNKLSWTTRCTSFAACAVSNSTYTRHTLRAAAWGVRARV